MSFVSDIRIEILTNDKVIGDLCQKYWRWDKELQSFPVKTTALKHAEDGWLQLRGRIFDGCKATAITECRDCEEGVSVSVRTRTDFERETRSDVLCLQCRQIQRDLVATREQEQLREEAFKMARIKPILDGTVAMPEQQQRRQEDYLKQNASAARVQLNVRGQLESIVFKTLDVCTLNKNVELNQPIRAELVLRGEMNPNTAATATPDEFCYFVRVSRCGGFNLYRAHAEQMGLRNVIILEDEGLSCQSISGELNGELFAAIKHDFLAIPLADWEKGEQSHNDTNDDWID